MLTLKAWIICCTGLMAVSVSGFAAEKKAPAPRAPSGRVETLACRLGTEDRHARIAVVTTGGKVTEFAYYSKWKPRTCSIYLQRTRDSYSTWADNGHLTTINVARGAFIIEHGKGQYRFVFRDVDRERYCGMDGQINGSLTIRKGSDACELEGIMEEGTLLGHANLKREEEGAAAVPEVKSQSDAPPAGASAPATEAATATDVQQSASDPPSGPAARASTADPAQTTAEPAKPAATAAEKPAESGSGNPFSAFFRALTKPRPPQEEGP